MTSDPMIRVRPADPSDAAELAELGGRTFRATYAADTPSHVLEPYVRHTFGVRQQTTELEDPSCHVLVAERGDTLIGYVLLRVGAPPIRTAAHATIQLSRLYVDAAHQGRGVGSALLDAAAATARSGGHDHVWLTVWERNPRAIDVYLRWGFADVGQVEFDLGSEVQTDRVLVLTIG